MKISNLKPVLVEVSKRMLKNLLKKNKKTTSSIRYILPVEKESIVLLESVDNAKKEMDDFYVRLLEENLDKEAEAKAESLKRAYSNISKASSQIYVVQDELRGRLHDLKQRKNKNKFVCAPANAIIDLKEKQSNHFASGLNMYKLLIVCFLGSFCGVIIEMLWCLVKNGYVESRAGLVYGPFNLLYGVGAVVLTVCLYKYRNRSEWVSFLGGIVVGSVVEYVCSWIQEFLFGTRSWDYSHLPFNLNGRICLLYSIFWGFLGVLWIKNIYPRMARFILHIPDKTGKIATWVLVAFFAVNITMSSVSVFRWSQRNMGIAPSNIFWEKIDQRFPDERMEKIYANMTFSR